MRNLLDRDVMPASRLAQQAAGERASQIGEWMYRAGRRRPELSPLDSASIKRFTAQDAAGAENVRIFSARSAIPR